MLLEVEISLGENRIRAQLKTAMYDNRFKIRKEIWNDEIRRKFCQENSTQLSFPNSPIIITCIFVFSFGL